MHVPSMKMSEDMGLQRIVPNLFVMRNGTKFQREGAISRDVFHVIVMLVRPA